MEYRGSILVVDDEVGPRESLRMIMKSHHDIATAENGVEALQRISQSSFDLVTLDLNMPDMHGIEILKKIKEEQADIEVVIVTGFGTLSTAQQALRYGAFDYVTKPFSILEMVSIANKAIQKKRLQGKLKSVITDLHRTWTVRQAQDPETENPGNRWTGPVREAFSRYRELSLIDFIKVLSRTLEEKNSFMYQHSERVDHFSGVLAAALGLSDGELEKLRIAAFLHDIGKVGISNDILNKRGFLSQTEWKEIQEHPRRGVEIVEPLGLPQEVLSIILHHHESFDGRGYPDGLKGDEIPLCARIIRIIDSYDAMISDRPYRQARTASWSIKELTGYAGTQFDPEIVEVFVDILGRGQLPDPSGTSAILLE